MIRLGLLVLVVVAPIFHYWLGLPPIWVFLAGVLAIAVVAEWIRAATEQLTHHTGPAVGGLLTVSLGSLAELLLALAVLAQGKPQVVHAQITGSIIGTSLLGLGLAIVVGGVTHERQTFKRERAGLLSSLFMLVMIALLLPALFNFTAGHDATPQTAVSDEDVSIAVSIVLIFLYAGNLVFTLITHRDVFSTGEGGEVENPWPLWLCLTVLGAATAGAALESEIVSEAMSGASNTLHVSSVFLGVIVLALVGTISDLFAAVWFARQDRMGLVMSICVGSSIQVALVVAPVLVLFSWAIGKPMTLVFHDPLYLFAIAGTAFIVNAIAGDGETTWFEGVLLMGVYLVFGIAFYFK